MAIKQVERLTYKELESIQEEFCAGKGSLACDENHAHNLHCIKFIDKESEIINRLVEEIEFYKDLSNTTSLKFGNLSC